MRALVVQPMARIGPGLLQEVLQQKGWELDLQCMDRPGATLPEDLSGYHAMVILGGEMGAYEEETYPYLTQVQVLIRRAVAGRYPVLGICLGAQLIARALGARVQPNPVREIGWHRLRLTPAGRLVPLFAGLPSEFPVFEWHEDTFELPEGAFLLAQGETCHNQAFVYGAHTTGGYAWGLQFHPEVTQAMIADWGKRWEEESQTPDTRREVKLLLQRTREIYSKTRPWRERFWSNLEAVLRGREAMRA